jgi:hypothetical protein
MTRPERDGPRLEKLKHIQAERRLKEALAEGLRDYPGKAEDLEIISRKHRELSPKSMRRLIRDEV